jgi:adenine-specific DNA-methyltransferase
VLRKSPVLQLGGGRTAVFKDIRPSAKTLSLSAEAVLANGEDKAIAIVFGPENGAVSEKTVYEAAREAYAKGYTHLYVFGFAIQPNARKLIEECEAIGGIPATYVQATPDLLMGQAAKRWMEAVNAQGDFGHWQYALVERVSDVGKTLTKAAKGARSQA